MSLFYLCPVKDCNRKYKTLPKIKTHLLKEHEVLPESVELKPTEISKDNKKEVEKKRNKKIENKRVEELKEKILLKKQQEDLIKKAVEEEALGRLRHIEEEQWRLKEEQLANQLESAKVQSLFEEKCRNNLLNSEDCCICAENPRDTAVVPCGHLAFCYSCINQYRLKDPERPCPVCRGVIGTISKIYS